MLLPARRIKASYGYPDTGLLTMSECADRAAVAAAATELPVICDADTGFGNAVNVVRTVREFERAGAAALHLEDQVSPKRCGAMDGKRLIGRDEMLGKLRAALDARVDEDFLIIGRTDAINLPGGLSETLDRGPRLPRGGLRPHSRHGPDHQQQVRAICEAFGDRSVAHHQRIARLAGPAFRRVRAPRTQARLVTPSLTFAAITAMRKAMRDILSRAGSTRDGAERSWDSVLDLVGLDTIREMDARYGAPEGG